MAARTLGLLAQVGKRTPIVMTGGVAKNPAAVHYMSQALGLPVQVPGHPLISGAFGAALLALDEHLGRSGAVGARRREDVLIGSAPVADVPDCHTCDAARTADAPSRLLQLTPLVRR
ncbi:MAG: Activator of (R)-2-hydroxyglutaryl-CoA dehydratase [Solirubrobacterales bacterium]|nr:Activator of (R)-2-hydroxyglutaryl-CoA dehydratase [Solirubrobacterales bacterium]